MSPRSMRSPQIVILLFLLGVFICDARSHGKISLRAHNAYRKMHGVPMLVLDEELTSHAQKWAEHLASVGKLSHSKSKYGENLYMASSPIPDFKISGSEPVFAWYSEQRLYTYGVDQPKNMKDVGHFTQVVWRDTQRLGCGKATNDKGQTFFSCSYYPPGNFRGKYASQVMRPGIGLNLHTQEEVAFMNRTNNGDFSISLIEPLERVEEN